MSKQEMLAQINQRVTQFRGDLKSNMDNYANNVDEPELLEILTYFEIVYSFYDYSNISGILDLIRHLPGKKKNKTKFQFSQSPTGRSENWSSIIFENSNQTNFGLRFLKNNPLGIEHYWAFDCSGVPIAPDISCLAYFNPITGIKLKNKYYYDHAGRPHLMMIGECKYANITLPVARSIYGIRDDMTVFRTSPAWNIVEGDYIDLFFESFQEMLVVHISEKLSDSVLQYFEFKNFRIVDGDKLLNSRFRFF